ncbi:M1 family aminopeptidase [Myxococcaceae bacterium GXIMD 01537]
MHRPLLVLLALTSLHCAHAPEPATPAVAAAPAWPDPKPPALRLPDTVRPVRYGLALTLLPAEPTYSGTVTAEVEVTAPVRQVWLHAQDLEVKGARIVTGGRSIEAKPVTGEGGLLGLLLPEEVPAGSAKVVVDFTGHADRERSLGLYGQEEGGEHYLYTFFEPIDARRAFPCFDEPGFKVPWQLTFTVKQEHVARANAPIVSEEPLPGGLKRVTFATSKPMPSYLVAFMVGPFDVVDAGKAGREGVPLQFIVPRGRGPETAYAASVTPRIVSVLEDFFDQPYPFEKLDVAVVPRFWGTMEHPGIVALGQPLTLIRPGEETVSRRQRYVNIALHELGHYWFGDVVTCRWWDDVWLNESLTSWLDGHTVHAFEPAWDFALEAAAGSSEFAMASDSLVSALPVRKPVASNDDIVGSFDNGTTYAKGAALLRMFEGWLGEERVRDLMRAHVRKHAWGLVTAEDFLALLEEKVGPDASRTFRGYVEQAGVPRVTAELQCAKDTKPRLKLAQERYLPAGSPGVEKPQTWSIPVCVRAGRGTAAERACNLLTSTTGELELPGNACPEWVLLNAGGSGYYRASYGKEQLQRLLSLPAGTLTTAERLAMLADLQASVERNELPLEEALKQVPGLSKDSQRLIVERGGRFLSRVRMEQLPQEDRTRFRAWVRSLYGARARELGWTPRADDSDGVRKLRSELMMRAAVVGEDPALVREAGVLARQWLKDRASVNAEVAWPTMAVAARAGDKPLFDAVLAQARATENREERGQLLAVLGTFRAPELSREALALLASNAFDLRESIGILGRAFMAVETRDTAWAFYREHFDALTAKMRSDDAGHFIALARNLCGEERRAEAEAFLTPRVGRIENGQRELARTLEAIKLCSEASKRDGPGVQRFLRSVMPKAPAPR